MGDRANIYLTSQRHPSEGIYLYTHWAGSEWPEELRKALDFGRARWNDDQYLARIIISRVFADIHDDVLGGGVGLRMGDNEHPIVVVDLDGETVSFASSGDEVNRPSWVETKSFADYVAQGRADYPRELSRY